MPEPGPHRRRAAVPGEAALKARLAAQIASLARLVPVDDYPSVVPRLGSWPGWMDAVVADLVLLCPLDPLAALRGLSALDDMVAALDHAFRNIDAILARQDAHAALYPVFQAALAQGEPAQVVDRAFALLTESGLLDDEDAMPQALLEALGPQGRETLVLRLCDPQPDGGSLQRGAHWTAQILLAGPDIADTLDLVARFGIEHHVEARPVVERLLAEPEPGPELVAWMARAMQPRFADGAEADAEAAEAEALLGRCLARCEAAGDPGLAQEVRRAVFLVVLEPRRLRDWLDRVPAGQRAAEQARALHEVACHERRLDALLFLLEWPELAAAARLAEEHHDAMAGQGCAVLDRAAGLLEDTSPLAAMLLYRRGAFCRLGSGMGLLDHAQRIARCAGLWARHPDARFESHAGFLDRLARESRPWQ